MSDTDEKPAGGGKTLSIADSPDVCSPDAGVPAAGSGSAAGSAAAHTTAAGSTTGRPAGGGSAAAGRQAPRPPDRRSQRRWVPVTAAWLCLLIGLADIIEVIQPGLIYTSRLSRIHAFVPGTLFNVTHTVSVIIGLLLLMLSHGLKRRKRRAWEAVTGLLAVSVVVHLLPFPPDRVTTAILS